MSRRSSTHLPKQKPSKAVKLLREGAPRKVIDRAIAQSFLIKAAQTPTVIAYLSAIRV
jgi:hypothetical protein